MLKIPEAPIVHKQSWGDYCLLTLEAPEISQKAEPGQFIMIRVSDLSYPLLRRPFSVHFAQENCLEIFFSAEGLGTILLSQKREGDALDILGPLGKGFQLKKAFQNEETALIGGGRGIAPLYFLAHKLRSLEASVRIFYGGKTQSDLPLNERFKGHDFDVLCSTDDGSFGFKGLVTNLFKAECGESLPTQIFACGPDPMMEDIANFALEKEIPAQFSLESVMGCGFGACWGCVKKIKNEDGEEWIKVCEEGPVFPAERIIWRNKEK
jgi:dihydroorotate dehydrogenase electron transfer subunit